jgi:hypothetical protein
MHHAFHYFVDGAIAARRHDQAGPAGNVLQGDRAGSARTCGGGDGDGMAVGLQNPDGAVQNPFPAALEFPGARIVY